MANHILIVGYDGVGKTSHAIALQHQNNRKIIHTTASEPNTFKFYDQLYKQSEPAIFDRGCICELVYAELFNRKPRLSLSEVVELLKNNNIEIHFISKRPWEVKQNIKRREINDGVVESDAIVNNIEKGLTLYKEKIKLLRHWGVNILWI